MAEAGPPTGRRRARLGRLLTGAAGALALALAGLTPTAQAADYVYEKVSPAYKGNGEVSGGAFRMGYRSSLSGDRVIYGGDGLFAGVPFTTGFNAYFARRTPTGWETTSPAATLSYVLPADYLTNPLVPANLDPPGVSADGSKAVVESNLDPSSGDLVHSRMYLFDLDSGGYDRMSPEPLDGPGKVAADPPAGGVAGTDDYGVVYFTTPAQLTTDAAAPAIPATASKLYRYSGGVLELASRTPDGDPAPGVPVGARNNPVGRNGVSQSGDVFWFYPDQDGVHQPLYRGEHGTAGSALVNASETSGASLPVSGAMFVGASPAGQHAMFVSPQRLVDEVDQSASGSDLYLYTHSEDPGSDDNLTLISADDEPADGSHASVAVVAGTSEDLDTVYFTTTGGQLVEGEPTGPGHKLYRWHEGQLTFVATAQLQSSSSADVGSSVSSNGRYLMFVSSSTGITTDGTGGTRQQYLYDAQTGETVCTSCPADGVSTTAVHAPGTGLSLNVLVLGSNPRRWLIDDGRTFFETAERLVPEDTNGKRDVYTWKDGELGLVSSGRSTDDSRFADASADGETVFFATRERLSGWDTDNAVDLYAARVGGGLPEPVARPQEACSGDDCQGPPAAPPTLPPLASGVLVGRQAEAGTRCGPLRSRVIALRRKGSRLERRGNVLRRSVSRLRRAGDARRAAARVRGVKRVRRRAMRVDRRLAVAHRQLRVCRRGL